MAKYVNTKDCLPMPELVRDFYNDSAFRHLKRVIEKDGFKKVYPVRAIFNGRIERYEIFDGIHRLKVAQALDIKKIPLEDETGLLTREQAIAEGIKANTTHASYNDIDKAKHLKTLGESFASKRRHKSVGRPETVSLSALAEHTGMDEKYISYLIGLLRLPRSVQKLIGEGKLRSSVASLLLRLEKTLYKNRIPKLAEKIVAEGWSYRKVLSVVEAIKKKGYYEEDTKVCVGCKRAFPKESVSHPCLCPECVGRLRSGKLELTPNKARTKAMQKFLRHRHYAEEHFTKRGKPIPPKYAEYIEKLHDEWKEARGW